MLVGLMILLGVIMGLVIGWLFMRKNKLVSNTPIHTVYVGIVFGLIIGIGFALLIELMIVGVAEEEYTVVYSRDIKGLEDYVGDDFVVGIDNSKKKSANYYYALKDDKGWKLSGMDSSNVKVIEIDDGSKPRIVKEKKVLANEKLRKITTIKEADYKYYLYIPKDSSFVKVEDISLGRRIDY